MSFISDEAASNALEWLVANARALGDAKADLVRAERMVDRVKALEMKRHSDLPVSAQEREAKASDALKEAYEAEAKAAGHFEYLRACKDAAIARVEAWRSLQATQRSLRAA